MKKTIVLFAILFIGSFPAWAYETLINEQTAAATSEVLNRAYDGDITIVAAGLSGAEKIDVEVEYANGSYIDIYDSDGNQIVLTATNNILTIKSFGRYRLVKPVTSSAVTVVKYNNRSP